MSVLNFVFKMFGVADGLSYLHHNDVIHGDMKGVSPIGRGSAYAC